MAWAFANHPNSEHWQGPHETKEVAIAEALNHFGDPDDHHKPCVAECRPIGPDDEDVEEHWAFLVVGKPELVPVHGLPFFTD